ncbi:hypothetical protein GCM10010869_41660 [Mesorhizobium tianshanense]|nr:hypothetical protein GCM10010869_41660 [Mesorhizobium tianshanense]
MHWRPPRGRRSRDVRDRPILMRDPEAIKALAGGIDRLLVDGAGIARPEAEFEDLHRSHRCENLNSQMRGSGGPQTA